MRRTAESGDLLYTGVYGLNLIPIARNFLNVKVEEKS
jgi:hypothetical protein